MVLVPSEQSGFNLVTGSAVATASSECWGGVPSRVIDGNTNGDWHKGSVQHTCSESNPWVKVTLDPSDVYIIGRVSIYNRIDCCMERMVDAEVQVLSDSGEIVASQTVSGISVVYEFDFDNMAGSSVRVWKDGVGRLNIAEIVVQGWSD